MRSTQKEEVPQRKQRRRCSIKGAYKIMFGLTLELYAHRSDPNQNFKDSENCIRLSTGRCRIDVIAFALLKTELKLEPQPKEKRLEFAG
jgi:hypothetical protein